MSSKEENSKEKAQPSSHPICPSRTTSSPASVTKSSDTKLSLYCRTPLALALTMLTSHMVSVQHLHFEGIEHANAMSTLLAFLLPIYFNPNSGMIMLPICLNSIRIFSLDFIKKF